MKQRWKHFRDSEQGSVSLATQTKLKAIDGDCSNTPTPVQAACVRTEGSGVVLHAAMSRSEGQREAAVHNEAY